MGGVIKDGKGLGRRRCRPPSQRTTAAASKQVGLVRPNIQRKKHTLNHAGTATRTGITKARAKQQKTTNSARNAKNRRR